MSYVSYTSPRTKRVLVFHSNDNVSLNSSDGFLYRNGRKIEEWDDPKRPKYSEAGMKYLDFWRDHERDVSGCRCVCPMYCPHPHPGKACPWDKCFVVARFSASYPRSGMPPEPWEAIYCSMCMQRRAVIPVRV
jgi:hypothetical protein